MEKNDRKFEDNPAVRELVPLFIGAVGASGSGKTNSALRLATGIQKVTGGDIYCIDTESKRALHYADRFKFRHVPFTAPFGPLDYLAAIEHCVKKGARIVIVDSMSHEHEGPGGVLEQHETELQRLSKGNEDKRDKVNFLAWAKPKAERRRLINSLLQMNANFIFCFRAKEKLKMIPSKPPEELGWMPIAGEEFIYEMTVNFLLYPNSSGIPTWNVTHNGEKQMIKLPAQFLKLLETPKQLDESIGETMARWATGGLKLNGNGHHPSPSDAAKQIAEAFGKLDVTQEMIEKKYGHSLAEITTAEVGELREIHKAIKSGKSVWDDFLVPAGVFE